MAREETDGLQQSAGLVIRDVELLLQTLADREAAFRAKADREKLVALRIAALSLAGTPEREIRKRLSLGADEYGRAAARLRRAMRQDLVGAEPVAQLP